MESCFECEGPTYLTILALAIFPSSKWMEIRKTVLQRLLVTNHIRTVAAHLPSGSKTVDKTIQDWTTYKSAALFWALIDAIYRVMFKVSCFYIFCF